MRVFVFCVILYLAKKEKTCKFRNRSLCLGLNWFLSGQRSIKLTREHQLWHIIVKEASINSKSCRQMQLFWRKKRILRKVSLGNKFIDINCKKQYSVSGPPEGKHKLEKYSSKWSIYAHLRNCFAYVKENNTGVYLILIKSRKEFEGYAYITESELCKIYMNSFSKRFFSSSWTKF